MDTAVVYSLAIQTQRESDNENLGELCQALQSAPGDLANFSKSLRQLYNEDQVTGIDSGTKKFLEVRDSTRQLATIYAKNVLPRTEQVIGHISQYMEEYKDLSYDQWSECLPDTLNDLKSAQKQCSILRNMHVDIIETLKSNEDKANVGIKELQNLSAHYESRASHHKHRAEKKKKKGGLIKIAGIALAPATGGVSLALGSAVAHEYDKKSNNELSQAIARKENSNIALRAAELTKSTLIPAIQSFLMNLETCLRFINTSKIKTEKMISLGQKEAKQKHYLMMRSRAIELSSLCETFMATTDQMRTNLGAIPENPADKNYVDQWLERQLTQIDNEDRQSIDN